MRDDDKRRFNKTPVHTRWKKGQSGNPSGAPKAPETIDELFAAEFKKKITVKDKNGNSKKITQEQALVKRIINSALTGDHKAQKLAMPFLLKNKQVGEFELLPEDLEALEDFKNKTKNKKDDDHE